MRNIFFVLLTVYVSLQDSSAQGIAPAQFFSAPLTLNPAFTGLINSDVRVATDYYFHRGPYPASPVRRNDVSIDMPILKGVLPKGDALGIGLLYQYFLMNSMPYYKTEEAHKGLSVAYHKSIDKNNMHHVSLGLQTVFTNNYYLFATYPSVTGEYLYRVNTGNIGVMYSGILSSRASIYGGYSIYRSDFPFRKTAKYKPYLGPPLNSITAGGVFGVGKKTDLYASAIVHLSGGDHAIQLSSYARFPLITGKKPNAGNNLSMYAGAIYQYERSLSPYIGFEMAKIRAGISYYIWTKTPIQLLAPAHAGFELSLIYIGGIGLKKSTNWHCPTMY